MVNTARTIRIVALLLVIFAAGVVTGRFSVPKPPTSFTTAQGRTMTSSDALARLKRHMNLSPDQERQFGKLFEDMAVEMSRLPPGSQERMDAFKRHVPEMEAFLKPEQRDDFRNYVSETERRFERMLRRRGK